MLHDKNMERMFELKQLYSHGRYMELIANLCRLREQQGTSPEIDSLLIQTLIKANYIDKAIYQYIETFLTAQEIAASELPKERKENLLVGYRNLQRSSNICQIGARFLKQLNELKSVTLNELGFGSLKMDIDKIIDPIELEEALLFPIIWPVAYGDMIIFNQFIKFIKGMKKKKVIVACPLNRIDIQQVFALNSDIDYLIDITLMEEEKDRSQTLSLINPDGYYNIVYQEKVIEYIIERLSKIKNLEIMKPRYLPVLQNIEYSAGWRLWEERAGLWLQGIELPKLMEQKEKKKKQITIHLRNADYSDRARNFADAQAQELVWELKKEYPDYELVRLGDNKMTRLIDCRNASHEELTVEEQALEIQRSELFIGTHSAPQMLAVACSDTPVICTHYTMQETAMSLEKSVAVHSYEPLGKQVKAILYNKMWDAEGRELVPIQNNYLCDRFEQPTNEDIMREVKKVLG